MSKQDWDLFLGSKKRTAVTHYSEGKKCQRCHRFITDKNTTGLCRVCKSIASSGVPVKVVGESDKHKELKKLAMSFLESLGCVDVRIETGSMNSKPRSIYDVTGKLVLNGGTEYFVVECGGSQERKLARIDQQNITLYIWPFNEPEPYLYYPDIKVCPQCGHSV